MELLSAVQSGRLLEQMSHRSLLGLRSAARSELSVMGWTTMLVLASDSMLARK